MLNKASSVLFVFEEYPRKEVGRVDKDALDDAEVKSFLLEKNSNSIPVRVLRKVVQVRMVLHSVHHG